jgi:hypothetical protein
VTVATVPDGFAIATPADWLVFDLDALADAGEVAEFLDAREAEVADIAKHRDELLAMLVRAGKQAAGAGVLFAAALTTARADGVPIVASLSVAALDRRLNEAVIEEAARQVPPPVASNGSGEPRTVGTRLPAGHAARLEHVSELPLFSDTRLMTFSVQYLLEVPGADGELLAITFASPAMAYRERLSELFADVAGTFEWTYS